LYGGLRGKGISSEKDESRVSVVVIDPGHGGKDWGASIGNAKEKDIVLSIAKKLGSFIESNYPDVKIIYTRSKDIFIPLHERAIIANKNDADLFISIHVNGVKNRYVQGAETFVLGHHRSEDNLEVAKKENAVILLEDDYQTTYEGFDPNSPESYIMFELVQNEYLEQSVMFASDIQDQLKSLAKLADRSVKMAGFVVLHRTTMPSVLVETGFISNASERSYLLSDAGKTNIASSIFNAFKEYKRRIESKSSFNLNAKTNIDAVAENKPPQPDVKVATPPVNNIYFSVQIMALKRELATTPDNFKGETNIFRTISKDINRYYSGKFNSFAEAEVEKSRIQKKYKSAYVVAFDNNKLISVKKALGKM
jgi:N-acetylmuramoyl-L-alanine amidase